MQRVPSRQNSVSTTNDGAPKSSKSPSRRSSQTSIKAMLPKPAPSPAPLGLKRKLSGFGAEPRKSIVTNNFINLNLLSETCLSKEGIKREALDVIVHLADLELPSRCLQAQRIILESFRSKVQMNLEAGNQGPQRAVPPDSFRIDLIIKINNELTWNRNNSGPNASAPSGLSAHFRYLVTLLLAVSDLESREEKRQEYIRQQQAACGDGK